MKIKLTRSYASILLFFINVSLFPQVENDIKLIYATSESGDTYRSGSRIILYFDGRIEKYSKKSGEGEILTSVSKLNQNEINAINIIFSKYNFLDYPDKIPIIKQPMWPSSSTAVKYKACQECEIKTFGVSSNSERKYIPSNYYEFINELRARLFSYF
jgi:hypothetical protein